MRNSTYALVEIEKKFRDNLGGIAVDTTWAPEEWTTVEGHVISAPDKVLDDPYRKVTQNVRDEDTVFFSYMVIFDYVNQPEDDSPVYRNLIVHEGKEYWRVPLSEIFARRDMFGMWSMVTDMVMVEPEREEYRGVVLMRSRAEMGKVKALPNGEFDYEKGDTVFFEERFIQKYNIDGKMYYLIPPRRIIAKS